MACKSSVNVSNTRTEHSSRSGGTATKISRAPISMPPALGSRHGRFSTDIPFRFFRLPNAAVVFGLRVFPCLLLSDISALLLASGSGQIAQQKSTLWTGINPNRAVKPLYGARNLEPCSPSGLNYSTTEETAYFACLSVL